MANAISSTFTGQFLGPKYSHNGKYNKSGRDVIPNIPLLDLKRKVIILIQTLQIIIDKLNLNLSICLEREMMEIVTFCSNI